MSSIYEDDGAVALATAQVVSKGERIFQIHKLACDDAAHVRELLALFDPPFGARVLDAGCGVGAVAGLMRSARPDLTFTLLNISPAQLSLCAEEFDRVEADFSRIPLPDGAFDAAMYLYSLGHGELDRVLAEAARVIRGGGILFVYDLAASGDDRSAMLNALSYRTHAVDEVLAAAERAGFSRDAVALPTNTTIDHFRPFADEAHMLAISLTIPVAYRFVRC